MGMYFYKVSTKPCGFVGEEPVYPATYAYKPWRGFGRETERANHRLAFKSGLLAACARWDKLPAERRQNVLIFGEGKIVRVPYCDGSVVDDSPNGFAQPAAFEVTRMTKYPERQTV